MTFHFTTVRAAFVSSFAPEGKSEDPSGDFQINFDEPMDTEM